jgi:spermidine synthase
VSAAPRAHRSVPTPITLSEEDGVRYLHFGSPWVQGAMRLRRPDEPVLDYVQQMMAWLLFLAPPAQVLQLGLGAGALTRFTLRHCPASRVTVVDCSDDVIQTARDWFALPADGPRLRTVCDDALAFVDSPRARGAGVIQVDLYDMHARGPAIDSERFYRACREALAEPGICVVNLFGEHASYERNRRRIDRVFGSRVLELPPGRAGNRVVLAFRGPPLSVSWAAIGLRAAALQRATGLPAVRWVRALRTDSGAAACSV